MTELRVRYNDLTRLHASIRADLTAVFEQTLDDSAFIGGPAVRQFEAAFAGATSRRFAVGVGSGTDALSLALRAVGVGPGDEVVVPANTFVATAEAVVHVGADPVLADVDPSTLLLSPESVSAVLTRRTTAVIPVHLYGHVVPLDYLDDWAAAGLTVIEDAAQAHLGTWHGRRVGDAGRATCYSFYPGKNLGALGDGGAVTCDDEAIDDVVRRFRDHGRATKDVHDFVGWCSRLDGMQAAFLSVKLKHLARWTEARVGIAEAYRRRLSGADSVSLVPWEEGAVHHGIVVRLSDRDGAAAAMARDGIETGVHYRRALSEQPAMSKWARPCPVAELAASEILSLPCDPFMTEDDVGAVCDSLLHATE